VSSPAADSSTSESAVCITTSILRDSDPVRAVDRPVPRSASMGSTRVAIQAGAMPNATPVTSETAKAKSSTGTEGEALMGTLPWPAVAGKATCKIRRVPANAMARPAAPPIRERRRLSIKG
jgi:hypothetical protein